MVHAEFDSATLHLRRAKAARARIHCWATNYGRYVLKREAKSPFISVSERRRAVTVSALQKMIERAGISLGVMHRATPQARCKEE